MSRAHDEWDDARDAWADYVPDDEYTPLDDDGWRDPNSLGWEEPEAVILPSLDAKQYLALALLLALLVTVWPIF